MEASKKRRKIGDDEIVEEGGVRCVGRATWDLNVLLRDFPPSWTHRNKIAIARIATGAGHCRHRGSITASRWRAVSVPDDRAGAILPRIVPKAGFFEYSDPDDNGDDETSLRAQHWHMNFADPYLFGYGEGGLLAQDELQVTEHHSLVSLAEAIEEGRHGSEGLVRRTVDDDGRATPVLVKGAPRCCSIDTTDIYGDAFADASESAVVDATTRLDPPTISNIVAMAAHEPGEGTYTLGQIRTIYETAYTGFRAVVRESGDRPAALHTGHWGCGAFGGNKGLMAAIQLLAAAAAGVDRVFFFYGRTDLDRTALLHGMRIAVHLNGNSLEEIVRMLVSAGYSWGDANENHVEYAPPRDCLLKGLDGSDGDEAEDDDGSGGEEETHDGGSKEDGWGFSDVDGSEENANDDSEEDGEECSSDQGNDADGSTDKEGKGSDKHYSNEQHISYDSE